MSLARSLIVVGLMGPFLFLGSGCGKAADEPVAQPEQSSSIASSDIQIGLLMETYDVNRWARDEAFFTEKAKDLGAKVIRAVADADQDRQNKQAETFLIRGVDVLVVVPPQAASSR